MALAKRKLNTNVFGLYGSPHDCSASDRFRRMWGYHLPDNVLPLHGPHQVYRTLDDSEWKDAISSLVQTFREVCLYNPKHPGITSITFHRDEYEEELQRLAGRFHFNNIELVSKFLEQHRFLIKVLFEVRQKIDHYFGADLRSSLEVFSDPEDEHSGSKLFALILTALPCSDASARLDRLDQEWWCEQSYEVKRAMNIDIDYLDGSV